MKACDQRVDVNDHAIMVIVIPMKVGCWEESLL